MGTALSSSSSARGDGRQQHDQQIPRTVLMRASLKNTPKRTFNGTVRRAKVVKVYDGDTITIVTTLARGEPLARYSLRLAGIDAPELRPSPRKSVDVVLEKRAAAACRDALTQKIQETGGMVIVEFEKEEKYGRLLGTVFLESREQHQSRNWCCCCIPNSTLTKNTIDVPPDESRGLNVNDWLLSESLVAPYAGNAKGSFSREHLQRIAAYHQV